MGLVPFSSLKGPCWIISPPWATPLHYLLYLLGRIKQEGPPSSCPLLPHPPLPASCQLCLFLEFGKHSHFLLLCFRRSWNECGSTYFLPLNHSFLFFVCFFARKHFHEAQSRRGQNVLMFGWAASIPFFILPLNKNNTHNHNIREMKSIFQWIFIILVYAQYLLHFSQPLPQPSVPEKRPMSPVSSTSAHVYHSCSLEGSSTHSCPVLEAL